MRRVKVAFNRIRPFSCPTSIQFRIICQIDQSEFTITENFELLFFLYFAHFRSSNKKKQNIQWTAQWFVHIYLLTHTRYSAPQRKQNEKARKQFQKRQAKNNENIRFDLCLCGCVKLFRAFNFIFRSQFFLAVRFGGSECAPSLFFHVTVVVCPVD